MSRGAEMRCLMNAHVAAATAESRTATAESRAAATFSSALDGPLAGPAFVPSSSPALGFASTAGVVMPASAARRATRERSAESMSARSHLRRVATNACVLHDIRCHRFVVHHQHSRHLFRSFFCPCVPACRLVPTRHSRKRYARTIGDNVTRLARLRTRFARVIGVKQAAPEHSLVKNFLKIRGTGQ